MCGGVTSSRTRDIQGVCGRSHPPQPPAVVIHSLCFLSRGARVSIFALPVWLSGGARGVDELHVPPRAPPGR